MRILTILPILLLTFAAQIAGAANPIAEAVEQMDRGKIRFVFEARDGVRGNGHSIMTSDDDGEHHWNWRNRDEPFVDGPVRVILRVSEGRVRSLDTKVGGRIAKLREEDVDLGEVTPRDAADYLMDLASHGRRDAAEDAILPATLARDVVVWPELLRLAQDYDRPNDVREQAIFWLGQLASEAAVAGLEKIVDDDDEEIEIRESAIFSLSQQKNETAVPKLISIAKTNDHPQLRQTALFWLAQHDDPRVLDLFEEILSN